MTLIEHERHELARALGIAIGRRLRALRKMRGITTIELAGGLHTPSLATIARCCAALDVPLDAVLSVADQFGPALLRVSQLRDARGRARRLEAARPRGDIERLLEGASGERGRARAGGRGAA